MLSRPAKKYIHMKHCVISYPNLSKMLSIFWQSENKNAKEIKPRFAFITLLCVEDITDHAKAFYFSSENF